MNNDLDITRKKENLYKYVLDDICVVPTDSLFAVSFMGAPGVGKTTIANLLSKRMNLYVASNDWIRRVLDNVGIDSKKNQKLVDEIALFRTKYLLSKHMSFILDCNIIFEYDLAKSNFDMYNALLFVLELKCDEKKILRRIVERKEKNIIDNYSTANIEDYYCYIEKMKKMKVSKEIIFYTIDTDRDLVSQIEKFELKLNKYLYNIDS